MLIIKQKRPEYLQTGIKVYKVTPVGVKYPLGEVKEAWGYTKVGDTKNPKEIQILKKH